jgi:phosphatidylserine/phosphatidylglycerophosphate/cardiolipin synthase-like enzyme
MTVDDTAFSADGLEVFFQSRRAGLEAQLAFRLVQFIEATTESLDCAIYDLRHPEVLAALARVAASGKRLRIAYDASKERTGGLSGDPKPSGTEQALETAGLLPYATPVHHGRHLMHDKFLVRDGHTVWTGSANFTTGGLELQDNTCLIAAAPALAASYTATFEALLNGDERAASGKGAPVALGATTLTPCFAPAAGEGIEQTIVAALAGANRVRVLAFLISDPGILDALAPYAGDPQFDIRGIYDPNGMDDVLRYTQQDASRFWFIHDPRFVAAPSHPFDPSREQDFMHNKALIIDDHLVIVGSYNFSENAEANAENLILVDSPQVAAAYASYFDALYATYSATSREHAAHATAGVAHSVPHHQMEAPHLAEQGTAPRAHVLIRRDGHGREQAARLSHARSREQFRGETEVGRTAHLVVFTDGSPAGDASARAVLATAEADYAAVADWFGGISLPPGQPGDDQNTPRTATPVQVLMDPQAGGAYHFGCNATDIYIEPTPQLASGFMVAELVEIFEAAAGNGWDCGHTNGEGLSRALAGERNPALVPDLVPTEQAWWGNGHADFVTTNAADDTDENSNGCGTLFLYYLHSQLGFSWRQIATTGGATLGECYQRLTGRSPAQGVQDFVNLLAPLDQGGQLALPQNGNPFPLGAASQPAPSQPQPGAVPVVPGGSSYPEVAAASRGSRTVLITLLLIGLLLLVVVGVLSMTGYIHF